MESRFDLAFRGSLSQTGRRISDQHLLQLQYLGITVERTSKYEAGLASLPIDFHYNLVRLYQGACNTPSSILLQQITSLLQQPLPSHNLTASECQEWLASRSELQNLYRQLGYEMIPWNFLSQLEDYPWTVFHEITAGRIGEWIYEINI